jgi:hypothetical protein
MLRSGGCNTLFVGQWRGTLSGSRISLWSEDDYYENAVSSDPGWWWY